VEMLAAELDVVMVYISFNVKSEQMSTRIFDTG
jgi:hypothetical protein